MNRMERLFQKNSEAGRRSLVLYFPIGDPVLGGDVRGAELYYKNGADVLEVGLPYQDPVLDGTTVKQSMQRALENTNLEEVFESIKKIREENPDQIIQIMTYFANIKYYGIDQFALICSECDVDGVLTPDAGKEERRELDRALGNYGIFNLRFSYYNITEQELEDLRQNGQGYIFQQAVNGGTGVRESVDPKVRENIHKLKNAGIKTPVFAGFGIGTPDQVGTVLDMGADGVIIGSAVIQHILKGDVEEYIKSLSDVMGG